MGANRKGLGFAIWPFGVGAALISFLCSRGKDGMLFGALLGFGVLGIVYWLMLWRKGVNGSNAMVLHLGVLVLAATGAMIPGTRLEEMGGMLYFIIPILAFIIVLVGGVVGWFRTKLKGSDEKMVEND